MFHTLISESESLGKSLGKMNITIPVNVCHTWVIKQLLNSGFRVERLALRMVLQGTEHRPAINSWVNCSRWAGLDQRKNI